MLMLQLDRPSISARDIVVGPLPSDSTERFFGELSRNVFPFLEAACCLWLVIDWRGRDVKISPRCHFVPFFSRAIHREGDLNANARLGPMCRVPARGGARESGDGGS